MNKEMIEDFKNGVRIMSIEARYLYSVNKLQDDTEKVVGYDTSKMWNDEGKKKKLPDRLYSVKMPYSLGLEKMYELKSSEFKKDDYGNIYSDMIINVTFKGAAKRVKETGYTKKGEAKPPKPKYIIKTYGTGKNEVATLNEVDRLEIELNIENLRTYIYKNGFILDGNKYVYFMRSTSKSRGGNMLFVKERYFYDLLIQWARLGIVFAETKAIDVAGIKSYESLILSGICGKVEIRPEEVLLINDYESVFKKMASVTKLNEDKRLYVHDEEVEYRNNIWDGMSLLDSEKYNNFIEFKGAKEKKSLNGKSFVLLRNLWFKSAAFNFDIQKYFKDNNVTLEDVKKHGLTIAQDISQIKLITTPNSLKILKIKDSIKNKYPDNAYGEVQSMFEYWLSYIKENSYFGVVKSEHGMYDHARRCNPQILMALPLTRSDMKTLLEIGEFPYMYDLRNDEDMFLMHIGNADNIDNTMIYELASYVPKITRTDLFTKFKNDTLNNYKENWKKDGIKIPDSDFCVCVSNPMEMMQYASGVEPKDWIRVHEGREAYCMFYDDEQELIAARNPCVCSGNIICLKNKQSDLLEKYMDLSDNIVVVNSIDSDIMERASGMDYDSDQMWISSNKILVEKARYCEAHFLTPVNKVARKPKDKYNTIDDLAKTDTKIAKGRVGDIVNVGQVLQAYYWHIFLDTTPPKTEDDMKLKEQALKRIYDKISMLSSASNVEIDSAKREYDMNTKKELTDLRKIGLLDNEDRFLFEYIEYGKVTGARKRTITAKEVSGNPLILDAYNKVKKYALLKEERDLSDEETKSKNEAYKTISDYLIHAHKKDNSKADDKVRKPLYFKYAFPNSVENSVYFENGMNCPMDNLCTLIDSKDEVPKKETKEKKINIMELMNRYDIRGNDKHRAAIKEIAERYSKYCASRRFRKHGGILSKKDYFDQCVKEIQEINLTQATIVEIFNACYGSKQATSHNEELSKIKKHMIDLIYAAHKEKVLECFKGTKVFGRLCFRRMYLTPINEDISL